MAHLELKICRSRESFNLLTDGLELRPASRQQSERLGFTGTCLSVDEGACADKLNPGLSVITFHTAHTIPGVNC